MPKIGSVGARKAVSQIGNFRYIWAVSDPVVVFIPTSVSIIEAPVNNYKSIVVCIRTQSCLI